MKSQIFQQIQQNNMMHSRLCRNGPSCHYLSQGTCWFYHPPEHSLRSTHRQNYNPISSRSQYVFQRPSYFEDDDDDFHYSPPRPLYGDRNNTFRLRRQQSSRDTDAIYRIISIILGQRMKIREKTEKKEEIKEEKVLKTEKEVPKELLINGMRVEGVRIKSSLQGQKSWFFEKSNHFHNKSNLKLGECSICINQYENKQLVTSLLCNHKFHNDCIEKWLNTSNDCPLCRKDFRQHAYFKQLKGYKEPIKHNPFSIF